MPAGPRLPHSALLGSLNHRGASLPPASLPPLHTGPSLQILVVRSVCPASGSPTRTETALSPSKSRIPGGSHRSPLLSTVWLPAPPQRCRCAMPPYRPGEGVRLMPSGSVVGGASRVAPWVQSYRGYFFGLFPGVIGKICALFGPRVPFSSRPPSDLGGRR